MSKVKIGDTIQLLRDISPYRGLVENARFKITILANNGLTLGFVHNYPGYPEVSQGRYANWELHVNKDYKIINYKNYPKEIL
jgi:hypothetical protein